ncbi:MAG TPA: hypothetical protein VFM60_04120, partial [Salinimicrobium sp.]|nr:hypothetical protein [Salinimicrobium sp.]
YILMYVISMIFQIPMFIYIFVKALTVSQEGSIADPGALIDWIYIALNVLSSIFQYLLSVIVVIATAFIYFDLNEKKHQTGTYETISRLGSSENQ